MVFVGGPIKGSILVVIALRIGPVVVSDFRHLAALVIFISRSMIKRILDRFEPVDPRRMVVSSSIIGVNRGMAARGGIAFGCRRRRIARFQAAWRRRQSFVV